MNKYNETFGIDISKDVFDCYGNVQGHLQFNNSETGFKKFQELLSKDSLVVMEATGYYHYRFAQFLYLYYRLSSKLNLKIMNQKRLIKKLCLA